MGKMLTCLALLGLLACNQGQDNKTSIEAKVKRNPLFPHSIKKVRVVANAIYPDLKHYAGRSTEGNNARESVNWLLTIIGEKYVVIVVPTISSEDTLWIKTGKKGPYRVGTVFDVHNPRVLFNNKLKSSRGEKFKVPYLLELKADSLTYGKEPKLI